MIRIIVPGAPVSNLRQRSRTFIVDGNAATHHYTPRTVREERAAIRQFASRVMDGVAPLQGAVDLRATFYRAVPSSWSRPQREKALAHALLPTTKPDFDNLVKMIDALKGVAWRDDAQITDCHLFKRYAAVPRTVIEVRNVHVGR